MGEETREKGEPIARGGGEGAGDVFHSMEWGGEIGLWSFSIF